ncbi:chromosome segregation protein SMC, partial [Novosphingobium sp. 1949]|nr:chromosome segregation protein SMC [Novosphingobium organovorum]
AENRLAELEARLPPLRAAVAQAEARQSEAQAALIAAQNQAVAAERAIAEAANTERTALRGVDQAEDARQRQRARAAEIDSSAHDLAQRQSAAQTEHAEAEARRAA